MSRFHAFVKGCVSKAPYKTLDRADQQIARVKKKNGTILRAYLCDICGNYHVTKKPLRAAMPRMPPKPTERPQPPQDATCQSGTRHGHQCGMKPQVLRDGLWYCHNHKNPASCVPIVFPLLTRPNVTIEPKRTVRGPREVWKSPDPTPSPLP
jgi:hypothetical protein